MDTAVDPWRVTTADADQAYVKQKRVMRVEGIILLILDQGRANKKALSHWLLYLGC